MSNDDLKTDPFGPQIYEEFFGLTNELMCIVNADGYILKANCQWEKLLGWSLTELCSRPYLEFVHPDDIASTMKAAEELERVPVIDFVNRYVCKDGTYKHIQWRSTSLISNLAYCVARDITDEVIKERERKEQDNYIARLTKLLDGTLEMITVFDFETLKFVYVNRGAEHLSGFRKAELLQMAPYQLLKDMDRDYFHSKYIVPLLSENEKYVSFECEQLSKDGVYIPVDALLQLVVVDNEKAFVYIARDITVRKRVDEIKNRFVSMVSHELRTPLTSIRGSLGLLAGGVMGELSGPAKNLVSIAANNTDRLVRIINDILDIDRIESGKMDFLFEESLLLETVKEAITENQAYADKYQVKIQLLSAEETVPCLFDKGRIRQVLNNLLSNAAKFSPPDSTIDVSIKAEPTFVRVSIRDYGPGIPKSFHSSIFDRFAQAKENHSQGGTGLGLSIAKAIVQQHQGELQFDTRPGKTVFYFDLPTIEHQISHAGLCSTEDMNILICEDDPDIAKLLKLMIERFYKAEIAYSVKEARELLATGRFHAMTLDLLLPDEDGINLLHELRASEEFKDFPVIIVSAYAENRRKELNGSALSVVNWLSKPIDDQQLNQSLQKAVMNHTHGKPYVLQIEEDDNVTALTSQFLQEGAVLDVANTVALAREKLAINKYHMVLLNPALEGGTGLDLLASIQKLNLPVLILSGDDIDDSITEKVASSLAKTHLSNDDLLRQIIGLAERKGQDYHL